MSEAPEISDEAVTSLDTIVVKKHFVRKHAKPDLTTAIAFLTTKVRIQPDVMIGGSFATWSMLDLTTKDRSF